MGAVRAGLRVWIVVEMAGRELGRYLLTGQEVAGRLWNVENAPSVQGAVAGRIAPADPLFVDVRKGWEADMRRRGCVESSIRRFMRIADECAARNLWRTASQVNLEDAIKWLGEMRAQKKWSGTTHDQACSALRRFGAYMESIEVVALNPFRHLESSHEVGQEGMRALLTAEVLAIVRAARHWETHDRKVKSPLALWYTFMCLTGLRVREAERIRWCDVVLGAEARIITDPAWAKNGLRMAVPLNDEIAGLLRAWRQSNVGAPDALLFPRTPNYWTWVKVLSLAQVKAEDERRRVAGPHSCRKWLATELDRQRAPAGITAMVLRHFSGITDRLYVDRLLSEAREFVAKLPKLWPGGDLDCGLSVDRPSPAPESPGNDLTSPGKRGDTEGASEAPVAFERPPQTSQWALRCSKGTLEQDLLEVQVSLLRSQARFLELALAAVRGRAGEQPTKSSD